jgi:hypothetical protein
LCYLLQRLLPRRLPAWDSATLCVKDVEDQAALAEREALERVSRVEAENVMALASTREEEATDVKRQWEVSEKEHREQFEELTLLQTRGSEQCHTIVNPPQVRNHLSEGMWLTALHHTEMVGELATLQAAVSSAAESELGAHPTRLSHSILRPN